MLAHVAGHPLRSEKGDQMMTDRQDRHYTEVGGTSVLAAWGLCLSLFFFAALAATATDWVPDGQVGHAQLAAEASTLDR